MNQEEAEELSLDEDDNVDILLPPRPKQAEVALQPPLEMIQETPEKEKSRMSGDDGSVAALESSI